MAVAAAGAEGEGALPQPSAGAVAAATAAAAGAAPTDMADGVAAAGWSLVPGHWSALDTRDGRWLRLLAEGHPLAAAVAVGRRTLIGWPAALRCGVAADGVRRR